MPNRYLAREDAPIQGQTWEILDRSMIEAAKTILTGRRILHIQGPYGLGLKAIPLSDPEAAAGPITTPTLPLSLIARTFTLSKRDLAAFERDRLTLDVRAVIEAAFECARLEDELIFKGTKDVPGLLAIRGTSQAKITTWTEVGAAAEDIIKAVTALDHSGFNGPYVLALAPERYNLLLRRYPTGNITELEHVKTIAAEGVIKAPALENSGILMAASRDIASIIIGQDMTIGFLGPSGERLEFSVSESLALLVRQPRAICLLKA